MKRVLLALLMLSAAACTRNDSGDEQPAQPKAVLVAKGLEVPWSIVFPPDGRILFTERFGRLRVIEKDGQLRAAPLHVFSDAVTDSEVGVMGLALHPEFAKNHLLYVSYGVARGGKVFVDVVRYRETGTALTDRTPILLNIPARLNHAGGRLKFGPDRKLYITAGEAMTREIAQDLSSLGGKIHRVNDDGSIPADNPFPNSPVWTFGHRNPQGLAWDPASGLLWSTEHGPSGWDGGFGGDELNIIERGGNYGWPVVHHRASREGMISPVAMYVSAHAPASAVFWRGDLYFGCLRARHLHRVVLDPKDRRKILRHHEWLFDEELGRIREVAVGLDGALYFSTSNRDGRGDPAPDDDRIFKLSS